MKIAIVNMLNNGSTGKLMLQIAEIARENGHEVTTFSKKWTGPQPEIQGHIYMGSFLSNRINATVSQISGISEIHGNAGTKQLIHFMEENHVECIHLHNLHGWYLDFRMLFDYIKKHDIKVIWTLHDCWSFTGQCPHFVYEGCEKWKSGCGGCLKYGQYPRTFVDKTDKMWLMKKAAFTGVKNMTIVTPSEWLAELVKQSYLSEYPVKIINNGIDLSVFKPTPSDFRIKHKLEDKKVILGVSFVWNDKKGLDVFIKLAEFLDESYQIVLVGTNDSLDQSLPKNIITIHRTENQTELAEIYTAADLLLNPTREDTYPTVNMEAIACGTPVITFNTGGSPEIVGDGCGTIVEAENIDALVDAIKASVKDSQNCVAYARSHFDKNEKLKEYLNLYK